MHCDNFVSYRSEDNASDLINNVTYITGNIADFTASVNFADYSFSLIQKIADLTEEGNDEGEIEKLTEQVKETNEIIAKFTGWQEEIYQSFSQKINSAAVSGSSAADTDFGPEYKSNESAYFRWIEEIELCISLENVAMIYAQQADTVEAIYKNIYFLHMNLILSCDSFIRSYVHRWGSTPDIIINKISTMTVIHQHAVKEDEEKKNKKISDINKKYEDEKKERINKYWAEHPDEKIALEQEKENLLDEISIIRKECEEAVSNIKNEIETVKSTYSAKISEFSHLISNLTAEKNSLGIFKTKEKKALQEKINKIENEKKDAELKYNSQIGEINSKVKSVATPFDDKITKLDKRIEEIDCELTKDR